MFGLEVADVVVMKCSLAFVLMALAGAPAFAMSLSAFMSEKLHSLSGHESCAPSDSRTVASLTGLCSLEPEQRKAFQSTRALIADAEETYFFQALAETRVNRIRCARRQIRALSKDVRAREKSRIAKDLARKIPLIRKLEDELNRIEIRLARPYGGSQHVRGGIGTTTQEQYKAAFDEIRRLAKKKESLETSLALIRQSVWMADSSEVQRYINDAVQRGATHDKTLLARLMGRRVDDGELAALASRVDSAFRKEQSELQSKIRSAARGTDTFRDRDKILLFSDEVLTGALASKLPASEWTGLQCRMNARYGEGRETLRGIGSMALTGASLLGPLGLGAASAVGMISLQTARVLTVATLSGVGAGALFEAYDRHCRDSSYFRFKDEYRCDSLDQASAQSGSESMRSESDCALSLALSALDVPLPEIKLLAASLGAVKAMPLGRRLVLKSKKPDEPTDIPAVIYSTRSSDASSLKSLKMEDVRSGEEIGYMEFSLSGKNDDVLEISYLDVAPGMERRGISEELFRDLLQSHPNARKITSELSLTNAAEVEKALGTGLSLEEAVKASPAYKVRKKLGFGKIEKVETVVKRLGPGETDTNYILVVSKD